MLKRQTASGRVRALSLPAILSVALGMAVLIPQGSAWAQTVNLCDPATQTARRGAWLMDVTYHQRAHATAQNNLKQLTLGIHYSAMDGDSLAFATGVVHITDGTSNTIMMGEAHIRPAVSCADVDGDLIAGVASVEFVLRDVSSGDLVPVLMIPNDGELDENGEEAVTIVVGRVTATATVRYWVFGTEVPR